MNILDKVKTLVQKNDDKDLHKEPEGKFADVGQFADFTNVDAKTVDEKGAPE